ncbi:MAG TPA: hypothetical protein VNY51_02990 [Candidatus Dormibacteraeota bacterium]|nr:hypothetical protein [Candidatus Dormibacteraeota bacterium]
MKKILAKPIADLLSFAFVRCANDAALETKWTMRTTFVTLSLIGAALVGHGHVAALTSPTRGLQVPQVQASDNDTFIEIDDPKGVMGTRAWSLDAQGDVIGSYDDAKQVRHGFFWHDGQFTTIDDPKAGHGRPLQGEPQGTTLYDINGFGDITGRYINSNYEAHSFVLRARTFTPIDDPASPRGRFYGTQADGINDAGVIVGDFTDEDFSVHGFVLHDGTYTTIDAPHAEHGPGLGTHAFGINDHGDIVLFTEPSPQTNSKGYLLHDGRFLRINDPQGVSGTDVLGINGAGVIVGGWYDGNGVGHGMVYCKGIFTTHDDPNAAGGQGTWLTKINANGDIAGWYTDAHNHDHGFLLRLGHDPCGE